MKTEGVMRVKIEHAQNGKSYLLTVTVQFSETEQATIRTRHLQKNWIDISPGVLASSVVNLPPIAVGTLRTVGRFAMIGGFVTGFIPGYNNIGGTVLVVGIGLEIYGWYLEHKLKKGQKDHVSVKELLSGQITIRTDNPVRAKEADVAIRNSLASLKSFLDESETLGAKDTFDL